MMEAVLLTTSYSLTPLRQVLISTRFPSTGVTHALIWYSGLHAVSRSTAVGAPNRCRCWNRIGWKFNFGWSDCVPDSMFLIIKPYYLWKNKTYNKLKMFIYIAEVLWYPQCFFPCFKKVSNTTHEAFGVDVVSWDKPPTLIVPPVEQVLPIRCNTCMKPFNCTW